MTTSTLGARSGTRLMLNKVPEVTIWFWVIKILCTTVGESFADWINMTLGVGLDATAAIATAVLVVVGVIQFRLDRYVPLAYWTTVVVVSVTGTLYTDILTDDHGVPLKLSSSIFAAILALVFGAWYAREKTLSIHSIVTFPREAFYWLAVLVTFALGTAVGDWTLELTGWGPGKSVLLPAGLIAITTLGWKLGAQPVLAFWIAYILTRPLGANIGDWFATGKSEQGLGIGTAGTSWIFLGAIAATVAYLSVTRADVTPDGHVSPAPDPVGPRQQAIFGAWTLVAVATSLLLHHTSQQPHTSALDEEEGNASSVSQPALPPGEATALVPAADVASFLKIAQDTLTLVSAGDQAGAKTRVADLETAWDDAESRLKPMDGAGWDSIDGQIDAVLTSIRAKSPNPGSERAALDALIATLS